jgi:hypothetical protein
MVGSIPLYRTDVWTIKAKKKKGKAVRLHAMEALGGRGGIAPQNNVGRTRAVEIRFLMPVI